MIKLFIAAVMGLGEKINGPLLGWRDFLDRMGTVDPRIMWVAASWDDGRALGEIAAQTLRYQRVLLLGHSHGGHRVTEICSGGYGAARVSHVIALDQKPPLFEHFGDFVNKDFEYPVPQYAERATAFYNPKGFPIAGCPYVESEKTTNIEIEIPHAQFPGYWEIQTYIAADIAKQLEAA